MICIETNFVRMYQPVAVFAIIISFNVSTTGNILGYRYRIIRSFKPLFSVTLLFFN